MDRTTATHEAGHAIARILTAGLMELPPQEAVTEIEIGGSSYLGTAPDGTRMRSLGQTIGPVVSVTLQKAAMDYVGSPDPNADWWRVFAKVGTEEDRRKSMAARMLICVMGAAAETKLKRMPDPGLLFSSNESAGDRSDFFTACDVLGLSDHEAQVVQARFLNIAKRLVKDANVWPAINAIAFALVAAKSNLSGETVWELVKEKLGPEWHLIVPEGMLIDGTYPQAAFD